MLRLLFLRLLLLVVDLLEVVLMGRVSVLIVELLIHRFGGEA